MIPVHRDTVVVLSSPGTGAKHRHLPIGSIPLAATLPVAPPEQLAKREHPGPLLGHPAASTRPYAAICHAQSAADRGS